MAINTLLSELNEHQLLATSIGNQHALVLAGAGCGKTRTIISRAAYLISNGTPAHRIKILTFTRRSASEIVERVRMYLGESAEGLNSSTFHTWCISLIRKAPSAFGYKDYSVIDREDQLQLFKVVRGKQSSSKIPSAASLCELYSYARNTGQSLENTLIKKAPEVHSNNNLIAQIMTKYEARKKERKYLDYDDILDVVAKRLELSPEIRSWVANQYDHILIDEMQDTNPLQWKIINPLKDSVTLFCVGDDAQSIYGFRGADFRNVHNFSERVPNSMALKLEKNYRSTQEILDASNWLLSESPLTYGKQLVAARGPGKQPQLHTFSNEWEEGRWIVDDIAKRRGDGANWKNHMILVRSAYAARVIESALLAKDIPYRFIGGAKLLESAHIRDVLSVLRLVANPKDEIAWMRFLTLWSGVGEVTANRIIEQIFSNDTIDSCMQVLTGNSKIPESAITVIEIVHSLKNEVSKAFAKASAAMDDVLATKYRNKEWDKRKKDYRLVVKLAEKHSSILSFIEEYLIDPVYGSEIRRLEIEDVLTVITIHSAKGTECETCYVVNVSPGAYPSPYAQGNEDDVEEERRVLYVALTRAKDELILTRNGYSLWAASSGISYENDEHVNITPYFFNDLKDGLYDENYHKDNARGSPPRFTLKTPTNIQDISVGIVISSNSSESAYSEVSSTQTYNSDPLADEMALDGASGDTLMANKKLSLQRDLEMEKIHAINVDACTAYWDGKHTVLVMGEVSTSRKKPIKEYREVQMIVFDSDGDIIARSYTNWSSFGVRQSFEFTIDISEFESTPSVVKIYPSDPYME